MTVCASCSPGLEAECLNHTCFDQECWGKDAHDEKMGYTEEHDHDGDWLEDEYDYDYEEGQEPYPKEDDDDDDGDVDDDDDDDDGDGEEPYEHLARSQTPKRARNARNSKPGHANSTVFQQLATDHKEYRHGCIQWNARKGLPVVPCR